MKIVYWERRQRLMGATLPRWYGIAWQDYLCDRVLLAIMPLNVAMAIGRDLVLRIEHFLRGDRSWASLREHNAYQAGLNAGIHRGKLEAYEEWMRSSKEKRP